MIGTHRRARYRGQRQSWFLSRFSGSDGESSAMEDEDIIGFLQQDFKLPVGIGLQSPIFASNVRS